MTMNNRLLLESRQDGIPKGRKNPSAAAPSSGSTSGGERTPTWQEKLDEILDKLLNREPFSYDLQADPLYRQYQQQYQHLGQQAMLDTAGQAQTMTGGYGNSYAQTLGQQAYQGYLQNLGDRVPELYELALRRYNQQTEDLMNQYQLHLKQEGRSAGSRNPGYDNQGYDKALVKQAQRLVGATADGMWGPKSAAAARAKGYSTLAEVIAALKNAT